MNTFTSGSARRLVLSFSFVGVLLVVYLFSAAIASAQSIVLNPPVVVTGLQVGQTYSEPGGRLFDENNNELPWSLVAINSNVDMGTPGSYQVTYSYLSARQTRFVSVAGASAPNQPPIISVQDVRQYPAGTAVNTLNGVLCTDPEREPVSMVATPASIPATAPAGTTETITITCRDDYGNFTNKTATIEIIGAVNECGYRGGRCVAGSTCGDGEMSTADACTDFSEICCVPVTNDDNDDSNGTGGGVPPGSGGGTGGTPVTSGVAPGGLVPCEGASCSACDLVKLGNNVLVWLIGILFIVFAIIAVSAGFGLVTSGGNPEAKSAAKKKMTNAVVGFIVVLAAWLLVDTIMRMLLVGSNGTISGYGVWSEVECGSQAAAASPFSRITHPGVGSRGVAGDLSNTAATLAALPAPDDKVAAAATAAGLDAEQTRNLQALMRVESGGCVHKQSSAGALGCMQIMPATARQYDPNLADLSDAEVAAKLKNDDDYNITLGAEIYADLYENLEENERLVFAAYNGGKGALDPSRDCPGQMRYECVWDSPGCYGTDRTDCQPNEGYAETRSYVDKVAAVSDQLK